MKKFQILQHLIPLFIAFILSSLLLIIIGENPLQIFSIMFKGSFGSLKAISNTLQFATPLMFTGVAVAIAFQCGLFNIGVEGQFLIGAITAVAAGIWFKNFPSVLAIGLIIILSFITGGIWALIAGLLKIYYKVNEVISTIMLNYIAVHLTGFITMYTTLKEPGQIPKTYNLTENVILQPIKIFDKFTRLNTGIFIAVFVSLVCFILIYKTVYGFRIRAIASNITAAKYNRINIKMNILLTMFLSGGIAGLAGVEQVCGVFYHFVAPFSSGIGFIGIAVSLLANNNPAFILISAIFFGALDTGSQYVDMLTEVPREIMFVIQSFIIMFVAVKFLFKKES